MVVLFSNSKKKKSKKHDDVDDIGYQVITSNSGTFKYYNGEFHCDDGPAVIHNFSETSGLSKYNSLFFTHGKDITEEVNEWIVSKNINPNFTEWTPQEKLLYKLRFV